ncbi:MAG TPA: hypothetical protein DIU35_01570 [Candidatus Latescibacteria bacterium]|nr:hypothetical protein [Gemmatimonadota bacterium]HCR16145.1 hypothetical protein [Candidatus Latescibacterota bacterium]
MLLNGNVITVDNALPRAGAVAVSQGRFVRVGTDGRQGPGGRRHPSDGFSCLFCLVQIECVKA